MITLEKRTGNYIYNSRVEMKGAVHGTIYK